MGVGALEAKFVFKYTIFVVFELWTELGIGWSSDTDVLCVGV